MRNPMSMLALTLACIVAPPALADCVDGNRERTAQEQDFADKLGASLKAALPAAPAPLWLEGEPQVVVQPACKDTSMGLVSALVGANYAASGHYSDRVKVTLRANFAYPGAKDLALGAMPKKPAGFKVHNVVVNIDGHNAQYVQSLSQAIDRGRLQTLIDQPLPDAPPPPAWTLARPGQPTTQATASAQSRSADAPATQEAKEVDPKSAAIDQAKDAVNKLRGLFGR